jgi:DNA-binding MarR family transcriptional regulator
MPILLAKNQGNRKKSNIILIAMVLLGFLISISVFPTSAQEPNIIVSIDQVYQTADFTVDGSPTIRVSGTFTVDDYTGNVYFGIYAPEGWATSISPEQEWVPFSTEPTEIDFEGEVIPPDNAQQDEHSIYVWASIDNNQPDPGDIVSSTSSVFNGISIIEIIQNRVLLSINDDPDHKVLPDSDIINTFTITNAATVTDTFTIILDYPESRDMEGWEISLSKNSFDLEPGETETFFVNQKVPEDAPEGDYTVRVEVLSEGHAASKGDQSIVTKVRMPDTSSPFRIDWMILFAVGFVGFGIGLAAFLGATEVGYFSLISLFLPLYVRLKKKDVLSHFTRGQIFGYIQANPGTHYNAIIQDLRLHNGVGAYHLQVLEREGFIRSLRDGIYKRFYPATMRIPEKRVHLSRIQKDLFEVIQKHPGITQKQISRLLDESKQVVNYHVKILEGAGLIRLERAGRETACYAGKVSYVPEEDVYQLADEQGTAQVMRM